LAYFLRAVVSGKHRNVLFLLWRSARLPPLFSTTSFTLRTTSVSAE
jgi:hypothetical protein